MEDDDDDVGDVFGGAMTIGSETTEAEAEFAKVLDLLRDAEGLKMYADVYTKLYDTYYKLKGEKAAVEKDLDFVKAKLDRFDNTVSGYQQELAEATKTIERQNEEIEEARKLADAMHARELSCVESLETMKRSVFRLEKELDARKRAGDDESGGTSAAKEKEKFEKEKARLNSELEAIKQRLASALAYTEELDAKNTAAEETIAKYEADLEEADHAAVRSNRLVEHMKLEVAGLKVEVEARGNAITSVQEKLTKAEKTLERREKHVKELSSKIEAAVQEQEAAQARANTFREQADNMRLEYERNKQALMHTSKELKTSIDDNNKLRAELAKCTKNTAIMAKRYTHLEQAKAGVESERERLRNQVSVMEREIMLTQKQAEADKREIENLNREKDILNKNMQKIQNEALANLDMLSMQEQHRKQLDHELELNARQITKQRLMIRQYEKDKDRMLEETIALNEKIDEITEEVRIRTADILDLKKALREETITTRKLTVALDTTRTERNMLYKNYTEALDEIQDLKAKLKMLAYQIEQLKEDSTGKEVRLKACEGSLNKCLKKTEQLRNEVQAGQVKLSEAKADITALRQEEARLNRIVNEGDVARAKLEKELEGLMNERDVVGAQLVRRNDEISLLYEKIRILEVTLHRGERQYEQRVDDIRLLRLEIIRLRKEKNLLSKGIENMTDLRLEVFNLERELGRERLRVRALEESLETPLNVHRWRKLQGTDPESVHLMQKLRLTQKKVLVQSEMLVIKDRELKETKNLYGAVKDMLILQPSPEIQQTLSKTQRALASKTTKMKCLVAELNMREQQVKDLKLELDRVGEELNSFKQKYYEMKRALDADEARRLRVPTPKSQSDT